MPNQDIDDLTDAIYHISGCRYRFDQRDDDREGIAHDKRDFSIRRVPNADQ